MHTETIKYTDGDTTCHGYIAYEETRTTARPAVLVCHAWAGQSEFEREKARALAGLGYVGFALDVYGEGKTGADNSENEALMTPFVKDRAMLKRRLLAGLSAARKLDAVDSSRIGAVGFCFGGLCAVDIARSGADINGVVSFHGLLMGADDLKTQQIKSSVLVLHGHDDPFVDKQQFDGFLKEMHDSDCDWQMHIYGNTKHAFTNPQANDHDLGTVYSARADSRSWAAMKNFLSEVLA